MTTAERTLLPIVAHTIDMITNGARAVRGRFAEISARSARRDAYADAARRREELRRLWTR